MGGFRRLHAGGVGAGKVVKVLFTPALVGVEDLKGRKERLDIEAGEDRTGIRKAPTEAWNRYLQEAKRLSK